MPPGIVSSSEPWPGVFLDFMAAHNIHYARVTAHDSIGYMYVKKCLFGNLVVMFKVAQLVERLSFNARGFESDPGQFFFSGFFSSF